MAFWIVLFRAFKSNARCYFIFLKLSVVTVILCHVSFVLAGEEKESDQTLGLEKVSYEFGTIEGLDCTNGCSLLFKEEYKNPMVFLMSTIIPDGISNDSTKPTKSSVSEVWSNKKGATILSESPPGISPADQMSPIYYFVTEPGKLEFKDNNGSSVFGEAGIINTDKVQCKGTACDASKKGWENVSYNSELSELKTPVVMAQVQGKDGDWATTALRSLSSTSFDIALEVGRQESPNSSKNIAYFAIDSFVGTDLAGESKVIFARAPGEYKQKENPNNSLQWSCTNNEVVFPDSTVFDKFGVIANKQTRKGSDGGWLRYCKQSSDSTESKFTFAFDEDIDDLTKRKHGTAEQVGYFAYELPDVVIPNNVCDLFPEPIQSWAGEESSFNQSNTNISLTGWSSDYLDRYKKIPNIEPDFYQLYDQSIYSPKMREYVLLGFDKMNNNTADKVYKTGACDTIYGCDVGNNDGQLSLRKVPSDNIASIVTRNPTETLNITAGNDDILLNCGEGSSLCSFVSLDGNAEVTIKSDLKKLNINKWGKQYKVVRIIIPNGTYIKNFYLNGTNDVEVVVEENSTVTFEQFDTNTTYSNFIFKAGSKINIVTHFKMTNNSKIVNGSSYPLFYGPDADIHMKGEIQGFILARNFKANPSLKITGAVTTLNFDSVGVEINKPNYECELPPVENGKLVVTPKYLDVLTCEVAVVEFKVVDDDGNVINTVQDSFTASHTPNSTGKWCEDENESSCSTSTGDYQSNFVNGHKTLYLSSSKLESYGVSGNWNGETETTASKINFVPYKFDVDKQFVVAGMDYSVTAKVSSCNTQDSSLSQDYVGTPTVSLDIVQPVNGDDTISLLDYKPDFEASDAGETTDTLSIQEAGQFKVTLIDSSFDCSEISGCPESGVDKLSGSFLINSRPWQFAICTDKSSDGNSKEKDSDSFAAAGESFDVYARPIKHTNSSDVCNDDNLLTNNYFKSTASVKVTTTLDTPSIADYPEAELGDLTPETQLTKQISSNDQSNKGYKFESLKYSEVGSFNFVATETGSFYGSILGGFSGNKSIGRFYPKYFIQGSPEWNVANQNDIAYLSQPYDSAVHQVYPMASGESDTDNALNNYRFFSSDLQASFGILDDASIENGFLLDTEAGTWSHDRKHWLLNDSAAVLQRVTDSDDVSRRDTPFNTSDANSTATNFGLTIEGTDPVSFTDSDTLTNSAAFPVQPPARYGRMALDDIGGNSDTTLTIPLRAEFWDGSEFVVNDDDDRSTFNSSNICKQVIWTSNEVKTTLASLNGSGSVDDGEEEVTANQNTPSGADAPREQVRLWLRMGVSKPIKRFEENEISCSPAHEQQPWLQYNWRGKTCDVDRDEQCGDEDPSTVVTFGIYRGNDRVIYRGESGLTGQ
ncbi:DUF6701 domain-containing protein [Vibrio cyclitrophicus]